jgi:hypothetical protein
VNVIFFSPNFPQSSIEFCDRLQRSGATVLGIGDEPFHVLNNRLKGCLTEYYRVGQMESYEDVLRAVAFFTFKYGKIDRFESLNEHWLEMEATVRTDFNITGIKLDFVDNIKQKSRMKDYFRAAGVNVVECIKGPDLEAAREFVARVGYPVIVKPDQGAGASFTYKVDNDAYLAELIATKPMHVPFIIEKFIDGIILTYDGLVNRDGQVVFAASHEFDQSIMEVVNHDDHLFYFCLKDIDPKVAAAGQRFLKSLDLRERFFHIEFFKSRQDGELYALEINMRPPGAWMTDAINFSYNMDVYSEWANMVVHNKVSGPFVGQFITTYASRKDHKHYRHSHEEIMQAFQAEIVRYDPIEAIFSRAMGNRAYQFRTKSLERAREIVAFIQAEV